MTWAGRAAGVRASKIAHVAIHDVEAKPVASMYLSISIICTYMYIERDRDIDIDI